MKKRYYSPFIPIWGIGVLFLQVIKDGEDEMCLSETLPTNILLKNMGIFCLIQVVSLLTLSIFI